MSNARKLADNLPTDGQLGGRNMVINGAMQISERSTSSTGLGATYGYFTIDRMKLWTQNLTGRFTMSKSTDGPAGFSSSLKLACTTAQSSLSANSQFHFQNVCEGQDLQRIGAGTSEAKEVTISFYCKANASFTFCLNIYKANGPLQIAKLFTVGTSWERVSITLPADTGGSAIANDNAARWYTQICLAAGTNYTSGTLPTTWTSYSAASTSPGIDNFLSSTSNEFYITGLQMEVGPQSTPFEHEPFEATLRKCQRYYVRSKNQAYASFFGGVGWANTTSSWIGKGQIPVPMRSAPTLIYTGTARVQNGQAGYNLTSFSAGLINTNSTTLSMGAGASGLTLYRAHDVDAGASTAVMQLDAEL